MLKVTNNLLFRKGRLKRPLSVARIAVFIVVLPALMILTNCNKDDAEKEIIPVIQDLISEISADSIGLFITALQDMGTRFTFAENRREVALSIRNKFIGMGYENSRIDSFFLTRTFRNIEYSMWQYNVTAILTGSRYPDSVCILGAHFDSYNGTGDPFSVAPGAHDNASGVAATLEVARVMKKNGFAPEKSIMFITFGAEEIGLFGSYNFVSDPGQYDGKISFMVNNDMVAYEPSSNPESWQVNILDYQNSHGLRTDAEKVILQYTSLGYLNDNTFNRYSDSYPFSLAGYKAIFFTSVKTDPYYHTTNDVASNLNFKYCAEITKASCAILAAKNL